MMNSKYLGHLGAEMELTRLKLQVWASLKSISDGSSLSLVISNGGLVKKHFEISTSELARADGRTARQTEQQTAVNLRGHQETNAQTDGRPL